jgi:aspartyl-tRNA synthetase
MMMKMEELPVFFSSGPSPEDMDATLWVGNFDTVNKLRNIHYRAFMGHAAPADEKAFVWIRDFPFFEKEVPTGPIKAANHPFVSPVNDAEFLKTSKHKDLLNLRSNSKK